jgi:hypothetical protein
VAAVFAGVLGYRDFPFRHTALLSFLTLYV